VCGDERLTYGDQWSRCRRLADALRAIGCRRGDRVAVVASNCHRYLEVYQTVPAAGMVLVPLNTRHTETELAYALRDSGSRVLMTDRDPGNLSGCVERVVSLPGEYETLLAEAGETDFDCGVEEGDIAGLFYTGGTTGVSKGVMLTHRNLVANTFHWLTCSRMDADDRWLVIAPMFHTAGTVAVLGTVWLGARHVVLPAFDAAKTLELIETERCTATLGVPTMIAALAEEQLARPRDVNSLRLLAHGGSPIATDTLRRANAAFPTAELLHLYGATETAPIATALPHEERILDTRRNRSCGQPAVGVEVEVIDSEGRSVLPGTIGEIVIAGPNVMLGYWNKPAETDNALPGGRYRSGDLGYLDQDGYLYLVDRAKDMIVTGGENVYSTEVEEVLYSHPMVAEATVFGVPDDIWGEAVHAVVVPCGDVTVEELVEHCRGTIASYKVPKCIELRTRPLPKSGAGKILKRELRDRYWTRRPQQIG
ncbi:MAG: class I adenylate-forming enzyme family protein, partial [Acidimicrobiales bacterium]